MKFIDFFDCTFVVNLPNRTDRLQEMTRELERIGMPFTAGRVELFAAIRPDDPGPFDSIGCRGCFLSHLSILTTAKTRSLKNVLVVEDDLEVHPDFLRYQDVIVEELSKQDWDIVMFGYNNDDSLPDIHPPIIRPSEEEKQGTQFYAVNGKTIDKLVDFLESLLQRPPGHPDGGPMHADGALNFFKRKHPEIIKLCAVPSLGGQRSSRSDVSPQWFDRLPLVKSLAGLGRSLGLKERLSKVR